MVKRRISLENVANPHTVQVIRDSAVADRPRAAHVFNGFRFSVAVTRSGVFKGGGRWCDRPPPWSDRKFFWLILHCFVGFISRLNRIKSVSRGMDVCIIACYYTDVHARPEASSDMSVFTITAGWLPLANFNRRTVASAVHHD